MSSSSDSKDLDLESLRIERALLASKLEREEAAKVAETEAQAKATRDAALRAARSQKWQELASAIAERFQGLIDRGILNVTNKAGRLSLSSDDQEIASAHLEYLHGDGYRHRGGSVIDTAVLFGVKDGRGFNAVLQRANEDDLQGDWQGIAWSHHALYGSRDSRREPFGMTGSELTTEIRYMFGLTGSFTVTRTGSIPDYFMGLVTACLEGK